MKIGIIIALNIVLICLLLIVVSKMNFFNFAPNSKGQNWEAKRFGNKYIVSIDNKSEIVSALTDFVKAHKIKVGTISGLGAVNEATLRFFNPETKKYVDKTFNQQLEVTNLTGNISTMDEKEYLHIHVTLGDDNYHALAGHLLSAKLNGAGEFVVEKFPCGKLERTFSEEVGLNFYDFDK